MVLIVTNSCVIIEMLFHWYLMLPIQFIFFTFCYASGTYRYHKIFSWVLHASACKLHLVGHGPTFVWLNQLQASTYSNHGVLILVG